MIMKFMLNVLNSVDSFGLRIKAARDIYVKKSRNSDRL